MVLEKLRSAFSKKKASMMALLLSLSVGCHDLSKSMHDAVDVAIQKHELSGDNQQKVQTAIHLFEQGMYHEDLAVKYFEAERYEQSRQEYLKVIDYFNQFLVVSEGLDNVRIKLNGKPSNFGAFRVEAKYNIKKINEGIAWIDNKLEEK